MKGIKKIRALRAIAVAGSLSALVVPTAAIARPATEIPFRAENSIATTAHQRYQLPANFRPEVQSVAKPYSLPSGYKPEVQTPSSPTVASNPASVVREIRTVTDDGSPTLAIVLASIALAMALGAIAYAWVRMTRLQRDLSSRPLVG